MQTYVFYHTGEHLIAQRAWPSKRCLQADLTPAS